MTDYQDGEIAELTWDGNEWERVKVVFTIDLNKHNDRPESLAYVVHFLDRERPFHTVLLSEAYRVLRKIP